MADNQQDETPEAAVAPGVAGEVLLGDFQLLLVAHFGIVDTLGALHGILGHLDQTEEDDQDGAAEGHTPEDG